MARCIYCGKQIEHGLPVPSGKRTAQTYAACSEPCRKKAERYFHFCRYLMVPGLVIIAVSLVLIFYTALDFTDDQRFLGAGLALLGLFYLLFPLSNSYAAENVVLRRSRLALRVCAGLGLLVGVLVLTGVV